MKSVVDFVERVITDTKHQYVDDTSNLKVRIKSGKSYGVFHSYSCSSKTRLSLLIGISYCIYYSVIQTFCQAGNRGLYMQIVGLFLSSFWK